MRRSLVTILDEVHHSGMGWWRPIDGLVDEVREAVLYEATEEQLVGALARQGRLVLDIAYEEVEDANSMDRQADREREAP